MPLIIVHPSPTAILLIRTRPHFRRICSLRLRGALRAADNGGHRVSDASGGLAWLGLGYCGQSWPDGLGLASLGLMAWGTGLASDQCV